MNIETYYRSKGPFPGLSRAEAQVLKIPFPLKSGWLVRHGPIEISERQARALADIKVRRQARRLRTLTTLEEGQLNLLENTNHE